MRSVNTAFESYVKLNKKVPPEMVTTVASVTEASRLADIVVAHLNLNVEEKQRILEITSAARAARGDLRAAPGRDRRAAGRGPHPLAREEADGALPEGVLPQRADARDPEGARRARRVQERDPGAGGEARRALAPRARRGALQERDPQAQDDVADVRRGDRRAQLHRLDPLAALGQVQGGEDRRQRGGEDPRRRPLRAREAEGAHPRVPRGARAGRPHEGPDPVPGRPAGRRQDVARAARSRAPPTATSCACHWAACATRPRSAATGAPTSARCPARSSRA